VLVGFWATEGLTEYDVQDVVDTLVQRSLAFRDPQGRITLHDLQFDYVRKQVGDISQVQERFVNYRTVNHSITQSASYPTDCEIVDFLRPLLSRLTPGR
jgi:hypothetical protein